MDVLPVLEFNLANGKVCGLKKTLSRCLSHTFRRTNLFISHLSGNCQCTKYGESHRVKVNWILHYLKSSPGKGLLFFNIITCE